MSLQKCQSAAVAAVEAYNRPGPRFRTEQYIVLIVISWTALFHAIFYRRKRRPWYRKKGSGTGTAIRYIKVDNEPKHWDLTECLKQYFKNGNPPERANLQFLIGLRNKIEHRHLPELDAALFGECQAALLNLEQLLSSEFGAKYALTEQLAVSLQFGSTVPESKAKAIRAQASKASRTVREYIEKFRGGLPPETLQSMKYAYSVFLVPRVVNRVSAADAAVQFVKLSETDPDELERLTKLNVLIREKHIPIANLDLHRPAEVVALVNEEIDEPINLHEHTCAWRHFEVRPPSKARKPGETRSEYCVYDRAHRDYLYTSSWVTRLVREFGAPEGRTAIVGGG